MYALVVKLVNRQVLLQIQKDGKPVEGYSRLMDGEKKKDWMAVQRMFEREVKRLNKELEKIAQH